MWSLLQEVVVLGLLALYDVLCFSANRDHSITEPDEQVVSLLLQKRCPEGSTCPVPPMSLIPWVQ